MQGESVIAVLTGHGVLVPLLAFALVGAAVFFVASRLAGHADAIAEHLGLGRMWAGALLLAASTSLPEIATDVNAALLGRIDIGVGDLFGSTLANVLVLGIVDLVYRRDRVIERASRDHAVIGTVGIALTALAGAAIASGGWGAIGHVGVDTVLIVVVYAVAMRSVLAAPVAAPAADASGKTALPSLPRSVAAFAGAAAALLVAAPALVLTADALAIESGASETTVGTLLVGFTTSFPEIAASVAAVRMGAPDLAVGNLLGSNAFNMCVLLAMDLAYLPGPLLAVASREHVVTAALAVVAVALATFAVLTARPARVGGFRVDSLAIVLTYAAAAWLLAGGHAG